MRDNITIKKETIFITVATILFFSLVFGIIVSFVDLHGVKNTNKRNEIKISELRKEIDKINSTSKEKQKKVSEYEELINYLESEMSKHREFIEDERQFLIWLMAVIGAVSLVILGFVGLSNRKEIEDTVNRTIDGFSKEAFERKLEELLEEDLNLKHSYAKVDYLKDAVDRQKRIRETNIVIFYQEDQNLAVLRDCKQLFDKQCTVIEHSSKMITDTGNDFNIKTLLPDGKCIVVYEVNKKEFKDDSNNRINNSNNNNNNNTTQTDNESQNQTPQDYEYEYEKVYKNCSKHNIYCILYTGSGRLNTISDTYTAMSNTGVSLYQYLNTLINL